MKTFKFKKVKGESLSLETIHNWFNSVIPLIGFGEWEISIQKPKRNNDQNALMWAWFACLAKETGNEPQDFYDHYTKKFLLRSIEINGISERVVTGTSKLKVDEFAEFLTKMQADAASEFGIKLPNRDDLYFKEFYETYYK